MNKDISGEEALLFLLRRIRRRKQKGLTQHHQYSALVFLILFDNFVTGL